MEQELDLSIYMETIDLKEVISEILDISDESNSLEFWLQATLELIETLMIRDDIRRIDESIYAYNPKNLIKRESLNRKEYENFKKAYACLPKYQDSHYVELKDWALRHVENRLRISEYE